MKYLMKNYLLNVPPVELSPPLKPILLRKLVRFVILKLLHGSVKKIRRHIGGDEQCISSVKTQHSNITFKHILLPVWLSAYRYNKKVYRFMVNARTGEVQGERLWSCVKITLTALTIIALGVGGYFLYTQGV